MDDFNIEEAMAQIDEGITILVPRVTQEEIEAYSRPRKRQAKKKYHILSFDSSDEEDELFGSFYSPKKPAIKIHKPTIPKDEKTTKRKSFEEIPASGPSNAVKKPRKRRGSKEKPRKNSIDAQKPKEEPGANSDPANAVKLNSCEPIVPPEPCEPKVPPAVKPEPGATVANSKIGKIRVKTAAELGSTVRFIDDDPPVPPPSYRRTNNSMTASLKNTSTNSTSGVTKTESGNAQIKNSSIDVKLIGDLYSKLFTTENQTKIRNVAEILQSIAENIKNNNERVQEITNSRTLTDAEKLMRRSLSFQDLKRKQEENEMKLKEKFESIMLIFDEANFELLFQLFFLGILKMLIVSVSYFYKKGTIFKKLINLLHQSLTNSKFTDERVFKLLKSKDFRERCITLVQFIEQYCKTEFFNMLFLSDADKTVIKSKNPSGHETSAEERSASSQKKSSKSELSSVPKQESFLLHLLKDSKVTESPSTVTFANQQQQKTYKTYAPAQKQHAHPSLPAAVSIASKNTISHINGSPTSNAPRTTASSNGLLLNNAPRTASSSNGLLLNNAPRTASSSNGLLPNIAPRTASSSNGLLTNIAPRTASSSNGLLMNNTPRTATNSNGLVNSFIFSEGQIKPYPNNVINIHTTEPSRNVRPIRPTLQNDANHFLHRTVGPSRNPVNSTHPPNNTYSGFPKVYPVNGSTLNGTHLLSTSNGNIENIQPGSYVNKNKTVGKDGTWNGATNNGGLRSLLANDVPTDRNLSRYLEHYGASNLNSSTSFSTPRSSTQTAWMG